ncbi:MAG: hypothetical protein ACLU9X_11255 [Alistipes shahii]
MSAIWPMKIFVADGWWVSCRAGMTPSDYQRTNDQAEMSDAIDQKLAAMRDRTDFVGDGNESAPATASS